MTSWRQEFHIQTPLTHEETAQVQEFVDFLQAESKHSQKYTFQTSLKLYLHAIEIINEPVFPKWVINAPSYKTNFVSEAIARNDVLFLQCLYKYWPWKYQVNGLVMCYNGQLEMVTFLHEHKLLVFDSDEELETGVIINLHAGNVNAVKCFQVVLGNSSPIINNPYMLGKACKVSTQLVKFLLPLMPLITIFDLKKCAAQAVQNGQVSTFLMLIKHQPRICHNLILEDIYDIATMRCVNNHVYMNINSAIQIFLFERFNQHEESRLEIYKFLINMFPIQNKLTHFQRTRFENYLVNQGFVKIYRWWKTQ